MTKRAKTTLIVIHVTATNPANRITGDDLLRMHKDRGFSGIGYNEWIDRDAVVQPGRGVDEVGAGVKGYNSVSYHISLEGGLKEFDATPEMMQALLTRVRAVCSLYPNAKICGHRDLSPDADGDGVIEPAEHIKLCPQFDAIPWAIANGLPAANIRGVWAENGRPGPDAPIIEMQRALRNRGYAVGPLDGHFGRHTRAAVEAFQKDTGLPITGQLDDETTEKLSEPKAAVAPPAPPPATVPTVPAAEPNYSPDLVTAIQKALIEKGYHGVGKVDGAYGPSTRGAILAFEADNGRPLSGKPDGELLAAVLAGPSKVISVARAESKPEPAKLAPATATTATGAVAVVAGGVTAVTPLVDNLEKGAGLVSRTQRAMEPILNMLADTWPAWVIGIGVLLAAVGLYDRIQKIRDHRAGKMS